MEENLIDPPKRKEKKKTYREQQTKYDGDSQSTISVNHSNSGQNTATSLFFLKHLSNQRSRQTKNRRLKSVTWTHNQYKLPEVTFLFPSVLSL